LSSTDANILPIFLCFFLLKTWTLLKDNHRAITKPDQIKFMEGVQGVRAVTDAKVINITSVIGSNISLAVVILDFLVVSQFQWIDSAPSTAVLGIVESRWNTLHDVH
jgi:hypothetical protein